MSRVDFYVIEAEAKHTRDIVACRLADKAYKSGQSVYIHTSDPQTAARLNDLLWTFQDDSFIPHDLMENTGSPLPPVVIGHREPAHTPDVFINLSQGIPPSHQQYHRIVEVVPPEPELKQLARERFRQYRDQGCMVHSHTLN